MLLKCCTQYISKFGKLSSGHRTVKGQLSFKSQRRVMPKNVQTTAQLHSSTHSSTLAWRIPWTEEPGGLHAVHGVAKSRTRLSDFTFTFHFHTLEKEMATTPVFLPGESQGWGSLVVCCLWGHTESDTTEAT